MAYGAFEAERMNPLSDTSPFSPLDADRVLLETPQTVAFFDRYPVTEGHTLVVPKSVVISLYELDIATQAELWDTVRRVREILAARHHPNGFNVGVNDGAAAGQTVCHAHIHVIPRYDGDVPDPRGGIRWVIPEKAKYWPESG